MVKILYGKKGMGKTKHLIEAANQMAEQSSGDVVFIDDSNQLMYDLKHKIRFINVSEFPVSGAVAFLGFLCGIIAEDYDIDGIFIDGLTYIIKEKVEALEFFFKQLNEISRKYNVTFYISINGDPEEMPGYMEQYLEIVER